MNFMDYVMMGAFVFIVLGSFLVITLVAEADKDICENKGFDYYDWRREGARDTVKGTTYFRCCNEAIGEDNCEWVKE